jgi:hypothetical protein
VVLSVTASLGGGDTVTLKRSRSAATSPAMIRAGRDEEGQGDTPPLLLRRRDAQRTSDEGLCGPPPGSRPADGPTWKRALPSVLALLSPSHTRTRSTTASLDDFYRIRDNPRSVVSTR